MTILPVLAFNVKRYHKKEVVIKGWTVRLWIEKKKIYICVSVCARVCVRACVFDMFVQLTIVIYLGGKKKSSLNNHKPIIAHLTVSD